MTDTIIRPTAGGDVALSDYHLGEIGLAVVYEAGAKSGAAACLKPLERLSFDQWVDLGRVDLEKISKRLRQASYGLDSELNARCIQFEIARSKGHHLRHRVVHSVWGYGGPVGSAPVARDFRDNVTLTAEDIAEAVIACAEMKRAAHWCAMRVAELILDGILPEREGGEGGYSIWCRHRAVLF